MTPLLDVRGLAKRFFTPHGVVHAVDDISFTIETGHSVAVVGESGCGKSTLAMNVLMLLTATDGEIRFAGVDLTKASRSDLQAARRNIGVVFQDPASSLDPRMRAGAIVGEPLRVHERLRGVELNNRVAQLFDDVGLSADSMTKFPHQFSGGQRQRISIARALALEPKLVVLDEPTSALDVSVQAQVLNLLQDLKTRKNLSYLYISHSLATVEYLADILIVMYLGRVVEMGPAEVIFANPRHPYTRLLIASVPGLDPDNRRLGIPPKGEVPSPINRPTGCPFASRCDRVLEVCCSDPGPPNRPIETGHLTACHNPHSAGPQV